MFILTNDLSESSIYSNEKDGAKLKNCCTHADKKTRVLF